MAKNSNEVKERIKVSKKFKKIQKNKSIEKLAKSLNEELNNMNDEPIDNENKSSSDSLASIELSNNDSDKSEENFTNNFEIEEDRGYNIDICTDSEDRFAIKKEENISILEHLDSRSAEKHNLFDEEYSLAKEIGFDLSLKNSEISCTKHENNAYSEVYPIKDSNTGILNSKEDDLRDIENETIGNTIIGDTTNMDDYSYTHVVNTDISNNIDLKFISKTDKTDFDESKSNFDIGNISYRDYNDITKSSMSLVDTFYEDKNVSADEYSKENNHTNEYRDFYDIEINEMPNRENLLRSIYEDDDDDYDYSSSKRATAKKGVKKNTANKSVIGKILKRRV